MKWLTIDWIRAHSRICCDAEAEILEEYGKSAEQTVLNLIGSTYDELMDEYGEVPEPLWEATLMLVDVSYSYRSPVSPASLYTVPYTFDLKVKPYVKL